MLLVAALGVGLGVSASAASAAEQPTSCEATLTADLDLSITVTAANASEFAFDVVGHDYLFLGRFDAAPDATTQAFILGPDNPNGFIVDNVEVEVRARSIGADGAKSNRISCGSVLRIPGIDANPISPAFCYFRADAEPSREGFLISDDSTNRRSYNRLIFEQLVDGTWVVAETIYIGAQGERFFLGGLETIEGLFDVEDPTLPTRVRSQFKRDVDGATVDASTTTACGPLPTTPPTVTPPTCRTSPSFYLGADGVRRILGVKATNGTVSTDDFVWDDRPRLVYRYLDEDGTVVRESVTSKWKDVPIGTYTVQVRSETFDYPLLRLPLVASDWVTCGTETVS